MQNPGRKTDRQLGALQSPDREEVPGRTSCQEYKQEGRPRELSRLALTSTSHASQGPPGWWRPARTWRKAGGWRGGQGGTEELCCSASHYQVGNSHTRLVSACCSDLAHVFPSVLCSWTGKSSWSSPGRAGRGHPRHCLREICTVLLSVTTWWLRTSLRFLIGSSTNVPWFHYLDEVMIFVKTHSVSRVSGATVHTSVCELVCCHPQ